MRKKLSFIIAAVVAISLAIANIIVVSNAANLEIPPIITSVRIKVTDTNNTAIKNAKVIILDDDIYFYTDNNGFTPIIDVVFVPNKLDANANWSTISILIIKDGYVPTLLYDCVIYNGRVRNGPTITMLTPSQTQSKIITIVETPPDEWTEKLIERN